MTITSAVRMGATSQATACSPATTTTAAAPPSSTSTARGGPPAGVAEPMNEGGGAPLVLTPSTVPRAGRVRLTWHG
jgi:hypothetical protein